MKAGVHWDNGPSPSFNMLDLPENVNHLERVMTLRGQSKWPLAVTSQSPGGLILVNRHYSDLIGPGSRLIWPRHFHCNEIYVVGAVALCALPSPQARQRSLYNRIMGLSILSRILQDFDPVRRASLLVNWLCHRLGLGVVQQADLRLLGSLGRVQPDQMREAIRLYEQHLRQLGQTERLADKHRLAWQRQLVAVSSDLPLDDGMAIRELGVSLDLNSVGEMALETTPQNNRYAVAHH
jgi:hypothetical protein